MDCIFIDAGIFTAVWYADEDPDVKQRAKRIDEELIEKRAMVRVTTPLIVAEVLTRLNTCSWHHGDRDEVIAVAGNSLHSEDYVRLWSPTEDETARGLEIMLQYSEHDLSWADCVSFALMESRKLFLAASFDAHFEYFRCQRGLDLVPLTVLPKHWEYLNAPELGQ